MNRSILVPSWMDAFSGQVRPLEPKPSCRNALLKQDMKSPMEVCPFEVVQSLNEVLITFILETSKNERLEVSDWTAAQDDVSSEEDSDEE